MPETANLNTQPHYEIVYNVTIKLTWAIHNDWVNWMRAEHIPAVMKTKCFVNYTFARLLEIDEEDGPTYTCQYYTSRKEDYEHYVAEYSQQLRAEGHQKWGNQFIAFRTIMQVVN
jgi:hypothetical protein